MDIKQQLQLIHKIKASSGTNFKKKLLKHVNPTLLKYAYNPYMKFNIKPDMNYTGVGERTFDKTTTQILSDLHTGKLSGHQARDTITGYTVSLTPEAAEIFKMILNKTMDIGLNVKSINQVFPKLIPVHKVMLAKLFDINKLKLPCYGSPKIDGVRAESTPTAFISRNGHPYKGLDHLLYALKGKPNLDGELTISGLTFQESSGLIRNDSPTPKACFYVFDLPHSTLPFLERYMILEDLIIGMPCVFLIPHVVIESIKQIYDYYNSCRETNFEGAVFKNIRHKYTNSRSWNWMKMKSKGSIDTKVVGLFEGKGKYENSLGGVKIIYKDQEVKVGSGFSDKDRHDLWSSPERIIERMIEVEYMEETDGGSLRHPVFKGLRPDKEG